MEIRCSQILYILFILIKSLFFFGKFFKKIFFVFTLQPNQYQIALKSVGEICQDYDSDKRFPALGFGAKIPPQGAVSMEFHLNFHPSDPHCFRIDGVMEAYQNAIRCVQLYGPTNFTPVINHVARYAT